LLIVQHSACALTGRENASMSSRRVMSGCSSIFRLISSWRIGQKQPVKVIYLGYAWNHADKLPGTDD
jgi:hypothetical protein